MSAGLGERQQELLNALMEHGSWSRGSGWVWSTPRETERMLDLLVRRGLVEVREEAMRGRVARRIYRPSQQLINDHTHRVVLSLEYLWKHVGRFTATQEHHLKLMRERLGRLEAALSEHKRKRPPKDEVTT